MEEPKQPIQLATDLCPDSFMNIRNWTSDQILTTSLCYIQRKAGNYISDVVILLAGVVRSKDRMTIVVEIQHKAQTCGSISLSVNNVPWLLW